MAGSFRDLLGLVLGWLSAGAEGRVTPDSRTFVVPAEVRAFDVAAEDRVFVVEAV